MAKSGALLRSWARPATGVGVIELANPSTRNALCTGMLTELRSAIIQFELDPDVGAVIVQAQGPAFCSGHDLKEIHRYQREEKDCDKGKSEMRYLFGLCSEVMTAVATSPLPFIAKVDGVASAAGCQLVASCDLAYASLDTSTRFVTPGVNLGFFCSTPAVALGRSVPSRKHVMEMLLMGEPITAERAERIGLVNGVMPRGELDELVDRVAEKIASKPRSVVGEGKRLFVQQVGEPLEIAYSLASKSMVECSQSEDCKSGIASFLNKKTTERKPT